MRHPVLRGVEPSAVEEKIYRNPPLKSVVSERSRRQHSKSTFSSTARAASRFAPWREKNARRNIHRGVADFNDALALVRREIVSGPYSRIVFRPLRLCALARKKCKKEHSPRSRGFQ